MADRSLILKAAGPMVGAALTRYDALVSGWVEAMKKRPRVGSKGAKARPRKASKPKGRSAPKALLRRGAAPAREAEVARLTRELNEAHEQQAATSEVLQLISSSPGDLQPVFATMLKEAVRICDAGFGNIYRWDGHELHLVAAHNTPPAFATVRADMPLSPGRMVATKSVVHVSDLKAERSYLDRVPASVAAVELGGVRSFLSVPMRTDRCNHVEPTGSSPVFQGANHSCHELCRTSGYRHRKRAAAE